MKLVAAYFNRKNKYKKLLRVFMKSLRKVMPKIKVKLLMPKIKTKYNRKNDITFSFLTTAYYALESKEDLIIADIDLLFLKKVGNIFKHEFDIAITIRGDAGKQYNTGLWFYRPTERAQKFLKLWIKETERLIEKAKNTKKWIFTHGGVDQMSLHTILMKNEKKKIANIKRLPCQIWNACQTEWENVDKKTRVIHIKSKLRNYVLKGSKPREHLKAIKKLGVIWKRYL